MSAYDHQHNGRQLPDERNLGGRQTVITQMKSHHKAIMGQKKTFDSHERPHPHINAISKQGDGKKLLKQAFDNEEKNVCLRKIKDADKGRKIFDYLNSSRWVC